MNVAATSKRTFAALRFRNYRLYLFSQVISFSGTWMQGVAQSWLVLQLTGSGTALGTVTAAQFIPTMLLAPYGGVVADRFSKRKLILVTQSMAGLLALLLGYLTVSGNVRLWMVYAIAAGFGAVTAVDNPSRQTFVMEMVGPDDVSNAVTLNSVVVNAARAFGPAVAGLVIKNYGVGICFFVNGLSYGAVILAMLFIKPELLWPTHRARRAKGQLREGFKYVWRTPILRTTLIMLAIMGMFTYEFTVTLPLLAEFTFGAGAGGLAYLTALMGVGAVVGGLVVAGSGAPTARRLILTAAGFGASVLALASSPSLPIAYVLVLFVGAGSVGIISLSAAVLQLNARPDLRGRVMSMFSLALIGTTPIGGPIVGFIGEHIDARAGLAFGGMAALGAAVYGYSVRQRLHPEDPADTRVPAAASATA